jgi:hypothetical protein
VARTKKNPPVLKCQPSKILLYRHCLIKTDHKSWAIVTLICPHEQTAIAKGSLCKTGGAYKEQNQLVLKHKPFKLLRGFSVHSPFKARRGKQTFYLFFVMLSAMRTPKPRFRSYIYPRHQKLRCPSRICIYTAVCNEQGWQHCLYPLRSARNPGQTLYSVHNDHRREGGGGCYSSDLTPLTHIKGSFRIEKMA